MPITAISLATTRDYVSEFDDAKGSPEATSFELGTLDSRIFGMLRDKAMVMQYDPSSPDAEIEQSIKGNEVAFLFVQYALRGWKNFKDAEGNDIQFKTVKRTHGAKSYKVADPELVALIPHAVLSELANEVRRDNDLDEADAKN